MATSNLVGWNHLSCEASDLTEIVSVGQKTRGYLSTKGHPFTPDLLSALDAVDASLGLIVQKLKAKGLYEDTLIIVASKHGQNPIDPSIFTKVDPTEITNKTGVPVEWQTSGKHALFSFTSASAQILTNRRRHRSHLPEPHL